MRGSHRVRCACIDIGANTTRLLVAEPGPDGLRGGVAERAFTRLGTARSGPVSDARAQELATVVAHQVGRARELGSERLRVVATSALRGAQRAQVLALVREHAGVPVELLSDEEEAALAFAGATKTLAEAPVGDVAVLDVGGGSCELAIGAADADRPRWWASMAVGSGDLAQDHLRSDPPNRSQLEALRAEAHTAFGTLRPPPVSHAVAVGGSATSLRLVAGDR